MQEKDASREENERISSENTKGLHKLKVKEERIVDLESNNEKMTNEIVELKKIKSYNLKME